MYAPPCSKDQARAKILETLAAHGSAISALASQTQKAFSGARLRQQARDGPSAANSTFTRREGGGIRGGRGSGAGQGCCGGNVHERGGCGDSGSD